MNNFDKILLNLPNEKNTGLMISKLFDKIKETDKTKKTGFLSLFGTLLENDDYKISDISELTFGISNDTCAIHLKYSITKVRVTEIEKHLKLSQSLDRDEITQYDTLRQLRKQDYLISFIERYKSRYKREVLLNFCGLNNETVLLEIYIEI